LPSSTLTALLSELGHAAGHQVHDAGDLLAFERAARVQLHGDAGGGLLLFAEEAALLRHRQHDARRLHAGQRLDGARELAFERTLELHALLAVALAEAGVAVEQLVAVDAALVDTGGRQLHAQFVHARRRHQDGAAAFGELVVHAQLVELGDDGGAVLFAQVGKQHLVVAAALDHEGHGHQQGHQRHHAEGARHQDARGHGGQLGAEPGGGGGGDGVV
jgi:hypothetical protein